MYTFYCQLDYESVPYPSPTSPRGNLADNGCGVMCASMLVENMLHIPFPPQECARFAKECGAREGFGTALYILADALAERFSLSWRDTMDMGEAIAFLRAGRGMVIANTQGDRDGYTGVFSDSGHYVLVVKAQGDQICVLDPMYRPGRYETEGRRGKVRMEGNMAIADYRVLEQDCFERAYFLFEKADL